MSLFDQAISRDPISRKTGQMKQMFGTDTVIPLWIADMDFSTPDAILSEMKSVLSQSIQGYNMDYPGWKEAIIYWYKKRYDCQIKEEWIHFIPGVIKSVVLSLLALSQPGDNILTLTPIYDPYRELVPGCERTLIQSQLIESQGSYEINWIDFRDKLKKSRLFLFVSPHNPGGVLWSKETLSKIKRYCHEENVIVISDEVHSDLIFSKTSHIPFFNLDDDMVSQSIVLHSPGKTFNVPGVQGGFMIIKNPQLREKVFGFLDQCHLAETNYLQQAVIFSSFIHCEEWYQKLLGYLADNIAFVKATIEKHCPDLSVVHGGASYLLFLNAEKLGMDDEQLATFFTRDAGLGLSPGKQYGPGGEQHMRLNVASPRDVLDYAMENLKAAYKKRHVLPAQ
ncbi:PatB family C-S lyase [Providencia rettgeri]|uniref:cysteine-S-conjugate beta-lyase n=1 Tax=Providencia rettgeri TaxID=587 RepID=A0AAW6UA26_PRORE|nr:MULTISPECIES: PatB family C-S lyase [Providencia]MBG5891927.1 PatB family C-S lyase [Providencia rettgeri]MBQ0530051.1 PatB family C-S lyase [Providencia rettgeri]MDI9091984.1 PatB family C-S lyase [Providencia rettgeri]MDT2035249.1 PatB family C-S lyase [Providencia rettgeri]THB26754.1 putative C-S lyase [Providencia sp. MGF014]